MADDDILATNYFPNGGTAWDVPAGWSLGVLPQAGDAVLIGASEDTTAGNAGLDVLLTHATDPAYVISSLTMSYGTGVVDDLQLEVSNSLTVLGSTTMSFPSGQYDTITVEAGGTVQLDGPVAGTLANEGGTLNVASISAGAIGTNSNTVTSVGSASGNTFIGAGGRVTLGSFTPSVSFAVAGTGELVLSPSTQFLTNAVTYSGGNATFDLTTIPFQQGETTSVSPASGSAYYATYHQSIALVADGGTVFQFTDIEDPVGGQYRHNPVVSALVTNDGSGGTLVTFTACYAAHTRIATPAGTQAVGTLRIGDALLTATGLVRHIRWVGRRSYAGRFLAANPQVQPIRFRAGCLGGGLPHRDLLVSPDHAMLLDGLLIPARCLVNGSTIVHDHVARVDYVHVELDSHDILLAEGAPSESFMDDDSRAVFHNAAEFASLYPHAPAPSGYCAPRVESGSALEAIRHRLGGVAALSTAA